jgi:response regulator RpfG family c-di-GMP phosphodiesterase
LKTLDRVRVRAPEIPIVILTGIEDENLGLEALKKGAQDYLVKDRVDAPLLMRAVRYAVERHRIQMEHEREHRALKHFAGPKRRGRAVSRLKLIENYSVVVKAYMTHDANASVDKAVQTAGIFAGAGLSGKEVIKIHLETLDRLTEGMAANDAQLVVWKARFLLLGVLSNVVDLYRMKNEDK